jgi:hypothetical protein
MQGIKIKRQEISMDDSQKGLRLGDGAEGLLSALFSSPDSTSDNKRKKQSDPEPKKALTARQKKLLTVLVGMTDLKAAANIAGVGRTTAHRWMKEPLFLEELTRLRDRALTEALSTVKSYTAQAAEELAKLLHTGDERLRRQICNDIMSHSLRIREVENLDHRVQALENKMNGPHW